MEMREREREGRDSERARMETKLCKKAKILNKLTGRWRFFILFCVFACSRCNLRLHENCHINERAGLVKASL